MRIERTVYWVCLRRQWFIQSCHNASFSSSSSSSFSFFKHCLVSKHSCRGRLKAGGSDRVKAKEWKTRRRRQQQISPPHRHTHTTPTPTLAGYLAFRGGSVCLRWSHMACQFQIDLHLVRRESWNRYRSAHTDVQLFVTAQWAPGLASYTCWGAIGHWDACCQTSIAHYSSVFVLPQFFLPSVLRFLFAYYATTF